MAKIFAKKLAQVLFQATFAVAEKKAVENIQAFARALHQKRWGKLQPQIARIFARLWEDASPTTNIRTWGASALPAAVITLFKEKYGEDVVIDHTIDPLLIGGLKMQVGDVVTDGTIANKLHALYE